MIFVYINLFLQLICPVGLWLFGHQCFIFFVPSLSLDEMPIRHMHVSKILMKNVHLAILNKQKNDFPILQFKQPYQIHQ